jgi:hypothetical protein
MKKPYSKPVVTKEKISLVKEEQAPIIKIGDLTKDGFTVIDIVDADRVLVSTQTMAKVISKKDC